MDKKKSFGLKKESIYLCCLSKFVMEKNKTIFCHRFNYNLAVLEFEWKLSVSVSPVLIRSNIINTNYKNFNLNNPHIKLCETEMDQRTVVLYSSSFSQPTKH